MPGREARVQKCDHMTSLGIVARRSADGNGRPADGEPRNVVSGGLVARDHLTRDRVFAPREGKIARLFAKVRAIGEFRARLSPGRIWIHGWDDL